MKSTKDEVIKKIRECAILYNKNLVGKNVLFITIGDNKPYYFETVFLPRNFLHFTGVKTSLNSTLFFRSAVNNKLSIDDITISTDGTTELKLLVLPTLMNITKTARMVGNYDNSKSLLISDKFAGTVTSAMGFVETDNGYYIPNTVIKEDIRQITKRPQQKIAATFIKNQKDKKYTYLTYIAKGFTIDDNIFKDIFLKKIDMENLNSKFEIPRSIIG